MVEKEQSFQWELDAKFEVSGLELNLLLAVTREFLNSPSAQRVMAMQQMNSVLEKKLSDGLTSGIVTTVDAPTIELN